MKKFIDFMKNLVFKNKESMFISSLVAIILAFILWQQGTSIISGIQMARLQSMPKEVQVMNPEEMEIYPEFETTGRVDAIQKMNIIARINGWLQNIYFREGDIVKKGQKLFTIEPDEYKYAAKNAQATVNENRAVFQNSQIELNRAKTLLKEDFISQEYYDNAVAQRNKDRAALDGAIEQLNKAKLDLSYTTVKAPMDGRIGKVEITEGNYVTPASGPLTYIYSINPITVLFTLKSSDFIELKRYIAEGKEKYPNKDIPIDVSLKLADGKLYDKIGKIEYVDNKIDETTGSLTLRAKFDNPNEILMHGDFVNVILKLKHKKKVMTIPQSATKTDVGTGYYVWVVDKDNKTVKKDIVVSQSVDNKWIVESGLDYSDVVIVKGIQDIYQSGQVVKPVSYVADEKEEKEVK